MVIRCPISPDDITAILVALLLGSALASACSSSKITDPPRDNSPIQTDSVAYHLQRLPSEYRAYVTATFTNRSGSSVYFARCNEQSAGPMFGVRRTGPDSSARLFSDFAWACVGGVPAGEVPAAASVTVRVPVGSVDQHAMQPPLKPEELVGLMRVELSLCKRFTADSDDCDPLPQSQRSSNAFYVSY